MTLTWADDATLGVLLPRWRPGHYAFVDPSERVLDLRAFDGEGASLDVTKWRSRWQVDAREAEEVTVTYRIDSEELGRRMRHMDDTHVFLSGAVTFAYVEGMRDRPVTLGFRLPEGWAVTTPLEPAEDSAGVVGGSYAALAQAPFELGRHEEIRLTVDGVEYVIAVWPPGTVVSQTCVEDMTAVIRGCHEYFGSTPDGRFTVIIHVGNDLMGGTEYTDATVVQARTGGLAYDANDHEARYDVLRIFAHELVHHWNGLRLRPASLVPFEPQKEQRTEMLWFMEGVSSYVGHLVMVRAGVLDVRELLDVLGADLLRSVVGDQYGVSTLARASTGIWDGGPWSDLSMDRVYQKGHVAGFLLDLEILRLTDGRCSLRTVFQQLLRASPLDGEGYDEAKLAQVLKNVAGVAAVDFMRQLASTNNLVPLQGLARLGLDNEGLAELWTDPTGRGMGWTQASAPDYSHNPLAPRARVSVEQRRAFEAWCGAAWPQGWD